MSTLHITDDGDEVVNFVVNDEIVASVNHDEHGWDGMLGAVETVKNVVKALGHDVEDFQKIV